MHRAILEEIEGKVQTVARGARVFPYTRVIVTLASRGCGAPRGFSDAFGERLAQDIREALEGAGCELPRSFTVEVQTAEAGDALFEIEYSAEPPEAAACRRRRVAGVVKGKAEPPSTRSTRRVPTSGRWPN